MKKTINVIFNISGSIIKEDGIDVFKLSPTLLSIGQIIKESNLILNPLNKEIGINIKPFKRGSFQFEIALFAPSIFEQVRQLIASDNTQQIKEILIWIGLIGSIPRGPVSLFQLIKFLKGRFKKREKISPNEVKYLTTDNHSITVNGNVDKLYVNPIIKKSIRVLSTNLDKGKEIDEIETYIKDESEIRSKITKEDIVAMGEYSSEEYPEENINVSEFPAYLKFRRGSYEGDRDNWSFWMGENQKITTTIKDDDFIKAIKMGKMRPNYLDCFLQNKIPHFCKTFSPGTGGEYYVN